MTISDVFLQLGEERLGQLVRGISIGKLRTYQLYERFKVRTHLAKVNTENLRAAENAVDRALGRATKAPHLVPRIARWASRSASRPPPLKETIKSKPSGLPNNGQSQSSLSDLLAGCVMVRFGPQRE